MQTIDKDVMNPSGSITAETFELLARTTGWMKFLAIMGFIGSGFILLASFAMLLQPYMGIYMFFVYFIVGIIGFFPALFLMQYASRLSEFCETRDAGSLEMAFSKQRSLFMFMGILTIIYIGLALILMVIGGMEASRMF